MPITLTDAIADQDALAADYNANLAALRAKMSETASVGIMDADIASNAGISGSKLSNVNQIPTDRLQDGLINTAKLGALAVTKEKVALSTITYAQLDIRKQQIVSSIPELGTSPSGVPIFECGYNPVAGVIEVLVKGIIRLNTGAVEAAQITAGPVYHACRQIQSSPALGVGSYQFLNAFIDMNTVVDTGTGFNFTLTILALKLS